MAKNLSSAEQWAWEQIRDGQIADFNAHLGGEPLDPREPEGWGDERKISSNFLREIFFEKSYRDGLPPEGVRIAGAFFPEGQALPYAHLDGQLWLRECRFETFVDFRRITVTGTLSLAKTFAKQSVSLEGAKLESRLDLRGVAVEGDVILAGANIGGALDMVGSEFAQTVDGNGLKVLDLFMQGTIFKGEVSLLGANVVGNQLVMNHSIFEQKVDGYGLRVSQGLLMDNATFIGELSLSCANVGGNLQMNGASFTQKLDCNGLRVGQSLWMHRATFNGDVILLSADVGGNLEMDGSRFAQKLDCNGLRVKQILKHPGARFSKDVILVRASVGGQLVMDGSSFAQTVNGNNLRVGETLFMRHATFAGDVILVSARVEGQLSLTASTFLRTVDGESCIINKHLFMSDGVFAAPVSFAFAQIGGTINLTGAILANLDLSGATVAQELRLEDEQSAARWQGTELCEIAFNIRNAKVGALTAVGAWPDHISLEGFTYSNLGSSASRSTAEEGNSSIEDWKGWLNKDYHYSPQPYNQLASVLAAAGRRTRANEILFAGRKRETTVARRQGRWRQWLWLTALRIFIGYGIGSYTFRVLGWIAGSAVVGMLLLHFSTPAAAFKGWFWCLGASLDRLLPLVELNKEFGEFFNDPHRVNLSGCVIAFFAGLRLWGWVLGSFLVAALAGLTQRA